MSDKLESLSLSLPEQKNYEVSYGLAYKLAAERLCSTADIEELCQRSASTCLTKGENRTIELKYLNRTCRIKLPEIEITLKDDSAQVELRDKILILHYLVRARGTPLSGKAIAYQELKEGSVYYPTFIKRSVRPLIDYFGNSAEMLAEIAVELGGYRAEFGDIAVTIPAFARVPVTLVIWKGDDEFPSNANILFDSTVLDYLPAEDINVLCQTISWKLVKSLQAQLKS